MVTAIINTTEIKPDGCMTVWSDDGRPIYLSREQAKAVHMAYAQSCEDPQCSCFQWGHEHASENS